MPVRTSGYRRVGSSAETEGVAMPDADGRNEESEGVYAPVSDEAPPQRTIAPLVWLVVGSVLALALLAALVWSAVRA